jgi:ABC-type phosphate/phosphonate transport system substrate-binding protein
MAGTLRPRRWGIVLGVVTISALGWMMSAPAADDDKPPLQVGMLASFYVDVPESSVKTSQESFKKLMRRDVGQEGETHTIADAFTLARQLQDGKLQIGVFHGFEYAWVRKKYDGIKPLTLAYNQESQFRCYVLVKKDSAAKDVAGLKGKMLAVPAQSWEESRVFIAKLCAKDGGTAKVFDKITKPTNLEDALDDVVDDVVQATVVDSVGLARYEKRKPARFERLRKLAESEVFPGSIIVYRAGKVDDATLKRMREALKTSSENAEGRQMLTTWKVTGFEDVPDWYEKRLEEIEKAFPAPKQDK